uniref:Sperm microtubule inner protein 2 n=1 Tax=Gopherus evgoodei TaxID=1825980 RepID=A0A8C4W319_9SAUR
SFCPTFSGHGIQLITVLFITALNISNIDKMSLPEYIRYIGATTPAQGATSDLEYLWRTAPWTTSILPHKHSYPGQIGWGVTEFSYLNRGNLLSGMQIKTGEFRQAAEDEITHRYQNPWQPPPNILDLQGSNTRGRLAWNCTDYDNFYHTDGKWAAMTRDSWSSKGSALPSLKVQLFCVHTHPILGHRRSTVK